MHVRDNQINQDMATKPSPEDLLRSRQLNPCDDLFWKSRGYAARPKNWKELLHKMGYCDNNSDYSDDDNYFEEDKDSPLRRLQLNLHSRQHNPSDPLYWKSRGFPDRPANWKELIKT